MKLNKLIKPFATGCLVAGMLFTGCTKDFEEVNTDPNQPTAVAASFLLTNAQREAMDNIWDEWFNGRRGNQLAQYWASNQYSNESRYQFRLAITNTYWRNYYARIIADLDEVIRLNTDAAADHVGFGSNGNQIAVAKLMRVWMYQHVTDCWGDIPYSQAISSEFQFPKFDSQESVYSGLITEINDALASMDSGSGPTGDLIYDGNMDSWAKFANSMKLRVAMRMIDANPGASVSAQEAIDGGVFADNADNALFPYQTSAPNNNPLNEDYKTRNDFAASNIMVEMLDSLGDPRVSSFYEPAVATGEFVGEVYGLGEDAAALTPNESISQRSATILGADNAGIFLDYAQMEFFLAEAAERGLSTGGDAATHYNNGVRASMKFWINGVTDDAIDAYLAQDVVDYATLIAAGNSWKEVIGTQKWIALYNQGVQGWTEWRRLDFGILQLPADGVMAGEGIPNRMQYPNDEQSLNEANYDAASTAIGGDELSTKVWWDRQ